MLFCCCIRVFIDKKATSRGTEPMIVIKKNPAYSIMGDPSVFNNVFEGDGGRGPSVFNNWGIFILFFLNGNQNSFFVVIIKYWQELFPSDVEPYFQIFYILIRVIVFLVVTLVTMYDLYLMQPVLYYQENIALAIVLGDQEKERFDLGKYFISLCNNVK